MPTFVEPKLEFVQVALKMLGTDSVIDTSSPRHPDHIYVKAGSFDDTRLIEPTHQSWTVSAVPWRQIEEQLESFRRGKP